jgi:RHS repeat-associated protein
VTTITPPAVSPADNLTIARTYFTSGANVGMLQQVEVQVSGSPDPHLARSFTYDARDEIATLTNARSHATAYAFDDLGRLERVENALGEEEAAYAVTTDHLDTPRMVTNGSGVAIWRSSHESFGNAVVDEDPDGDSNLVSFHVRFPGQYADAETGLHDNYLRAYDPSTGTYLSADPIGQKGGANVFQYALSNPLRYSDPFGLDAVAVAFPGYQAQIPNTNSRAPVGHAGVLLYDESGYTKYYEYGRYENPADPCACGQVRSPVGGIPNLDMDANGNPTPSSMANALGAISRKSGQRRPVNGVHIPGVSFKAADAYARSRMQQNTDPNRAPYDFLSNSCMHFVDDVLNAGGVDTPGPPTVPTPTNYINRLKNVGGYTPVTHLGSNQ